MEDMVDMEVLEEDMEELEGDLVMEDMEGDVEEIMEVMGDVINYDNLFVYPILI